MNNASNLRKAESSKLVFIYMKRKLYDASELAMIMGVVFLSLQLSSSARIAKEAIFARETVSTEYTSAQCVQHCQLEMMSILQDRVKDNKVIETLSAGSFSVNKTVFEHVCSLYRHGRICIEECNDSKIKNSVLIAYRPLDTLCLEFYRDFAMNLECFHSTSKLVEQRCLPICGDSKQIQQNSRLFMQNLDSLSSKAEKRRAEIMMHSICNFISCQMTCQRPIIYRRCGNYAQRLMDIFFANLGKTLQEVVARSDPYLEYFPTICVNVARQSAPNGSKSSDKNYSVMSLPLLLVISFMCFTVCFLA